MTILLDTRIPRTLDTLVRDWAGGDHRGITLEAWLFEDEAARRRAEQVFAASGIHARLRSAYKPLVHAFLEEFDTIGLTRAARAAGIRLATAATTSTTLPTSAYTTTDRAET